MSKDCNHRTPLDEGYGYGAVSGWSGIGGTFRCPDCCECLWFEEGSHTNNEKAHNDKKRQENIKWKPSIVDGWSEPLNIFDLINKEELE
jgi:transcription initiation factor IIE alpha subunit